MRSGEAEHFPGLESIPATPSVTRDRARAVRSWVAGGLANDPLALLQLVAAELAGSVSVDRIAGIVADSAKKAIGADLLVVAISEETGRPLRVLHESGLSTTARHRLPAVLAGASSVLRRNGGSEATSLDAVAEPLVGPATRTLGGRSPGGRTLAALMPPHERPRGIVLAGRTRAGTFSRADRGFLNALAAVTALALERLPFWHDPRPRPFAGRRFTRSDVRVGDMQIDLEDQQVIFGDRSVRLTPSELRILLLLAAEPGRPRTRREILRHLWHTDHVGDERACDAHISNLRRKIERDPSRPDRVVTLRGVGYVLQLPAS